jgi:hypothetical protein
MKILCDELQGKVFLFLVREMNILKYGIEIKIQFDSLFIYFLTKIQLQNKLSKRKKQAHKENTNQGNLSFR